MRCSVAKYAPLWSSIVMVLMPGTSFFLSKKIIGVLVVLTTFFRYSTSDVFLDIEIKIQSTCVCNNVLSCFFSTVASSWL